MRRGLIAWDETEVPRAALDARAARLGQAMTAAKLPALALYSNISRPCAVSWLTNFVPYWSQALCVLRPGARPTVFVSFSKRVQDWAESTTSAEVISTPAVGAEAAKRLGKLDRIGVVELGGLPAGIAQPLIEGTGAAPMDASELFAQARGIADATELALTARAADIAKAAFDAALAAAPVSSAALQAIIDAKARGAGAEEVLVRIAPDSATDVRLRRIEGDAPLGASAHVQLSVAYKGAWVRLGRAWAREAPPPSWNVAAAWFESAIAAFDGGLNPSAPLALPAHNGASWTLEQCIGGSPFTVRATSANGARFAPQPGAIVTLTARIEMGGAPWLRSATIVAGSGKDAYARALT
jgi:hypothetical protein